MYEFSSDPPGPEALKWILRPPDPPGQEVIHVGMILKGVGGGGKVATKLKHQFVILLRSILQHSKSNPIHFIILTDVQSPEAIVPIFTRYIVRYAKVKVEYDFFDCSAIAQTFSSKIILYITLLKNFNTVLHNWKNYGSISILF